MSDNHIGRVDSDVWNPIPHGDGTWSSPVACSRTDQPYRLAKWKAVPGVYERPSGMPWSETFAVYKGRGSVRFGNETIELKPGVVVNLAQGEPYVLTIDEALEKFAVITR